MANYQELQTEAREYYSLCDQARALGIDTVATEETSVDLDSVAKLREQVETAERAVWLAQPKCPACRGTGGGVYNDCPTCDGNGVVA